MFEKASGFIKKNRKILKKSNYNLDNVLEVYDNLFEDEEKRQPRFTLWYTKSIEKDASAIMSAATSDRKLQSVNLASFTDSDFVDSPESGYDLNGYAESSTYYSVTGQFVLGTTATGTIPDDSIVTSITEEIDENGNEYFYVELLILAGYEKYNLSFAGESLTTQVTLTGKGVKYKPYMIEVSLYGNKRKITFEELQLNSTNIDLAKTKISIDKNDLMQNVETANTLKGNIVSDYIKGISKGFVTISCSDYYNQANQKKIDWQKGEVVQVDNIVCFENDKYLNGKSCIERKILISLIICYFVISDESAMVITKYPCHGIMSILLCIITILVYEFSNSLITYAFVIIDYFFFNLVLSRIDIDAILESDHCNHS